MPTSFLAPTKDLENQMFLVDPESAEASIRIVAQRP
jgi:hypothetical protein